MPPPNPVRKPATVVPTTSSLLLQPNIAPVEHADDHRRVINTPGNRQDGASVKNGHALLRTVPGLVRVHELRLLLTGDCLLGHNDLGDGEVARDIKHRLLQNLLRNGAKAAGAGLAGQRETCHLANGLVLELELNALDSRTCERTA